MYTCGKQHIGSPLYMRKTIKKTHVNQFAPFTSRSPLHIATELPHWRRLTPPTGCIDFPALPAARQKFHWPYHISPTLGIQQLAPSTSGNVNNTSPRLILTWFTKYGISKYMTLSFQSEVSKGSKSSGHRRVLRYGTLHA